MNTEARVRVQVTRQFTASAERVYDAWLDPEKARKFLFATPSGEMVRAEIDPRVGGRFCFTDRRGDEDVDHVGEYLILDRPHRLAFTFAVPKYSSESTTVTIDIRSTERGCQLTLTHDGVLASYDEKTKDGWTSILEGLARTLA